MPRSKLATDYDFAKIPSAEIQRSSFDRSHGHKTTFNAGLLIPIFCDEALPGDTFNLNMSGFARLATPLKPIMDNMIMETFFFAVPNRLVWDNWEKFNGQQDNPNDTTDYVIPKMTLTNNEETELSLIDYLGIPLKSGVQISALPLRAHNLIYNEWFRDQNLIDSAPVIKTDSGDAWDSYKLLRRGKRHDYFTSALPWPQKGQEVTVPLASLAPVTQGPNATPGGNVAWRNQEQGTFHDLTTSGSKLQWNSTAAAETDAMYADLTQATAITINQLREAFQVQKLYERDARGGTRYTEIIESHFGVSSDDARLQRPEYLGGGSTPVNVTEVQQTSASTAEAPQGNLAATGRAQFSKHGFTKSFTEHCIILGYVCVRADLTYQQGLNRMWSRSTRFDFYWPALSHLGEQEVLNKEIFSDGTEEDNSVFGYQERYAEYRYKPSIITGRFRSSAQQSLDPWHLSQDFQTRPVLNEAFITENPPVDRVIAVQSEPHFLFDSWFKLTTARPMPTYAVPGMIDHF